LDQSVDIHNQFEPKTKEDWLEVISASLKMEASDVDAKLLFRSLENIDVEPLHMHADKTLSLLSFPEHRVATEIINAQDVSTKSLTESLSNGITVFDIILNKNHSFDADQLIENCHYNFCLSSNFKAEMNTINEKVQSKDISVLFQIDIYSQTHSSADKLFSTIEKDYPKVQYLVDNSHVHNAGASITQELVYALSAGYDLLKRGIKDVSRIQFRVSLDSLFFANISKLRVLRFIWETLLTENTITFNNDTVIISSVNSLREQTLYDPWVNILRSTASSFAAVTGGANILSAYSYDKSFSDINDEKQTDLGIRNARNILHILLQESHLDQVVDPSAGSYAIENISSQIAEKTWTEFMTKDSNGGFFNQLEEFSKEVSEVAQKRYALVRSRKQTVTGINNFANQDETLTSIYKKDDVIVSNKTDALFPLRRVGQEFEQLRHSLKSEEVIFIGLYGSMSKLSGRSNFCRNVFEVLGLTVVEGVATENLALLVDQFKKSKAKHSILCAIDEDYAEIAEKALSQLKAAGSNTVFLAGKPKTVDLEDLQNKGLTSPLFMGQDVYAVLSKFIEEVKS